METLINAPIEWAVAELAQPGQSESGDRHLVLPTPDGGLVAVVDGLGHGAEAASAAKVAVRALERGGDRPLAQLFRDCHQSLIGTRGAVISAASFSVPDQTMTWLGVGNVEGRLLRAPVSGGPPIAHAVAAGPGVATGSVAFDVTRAQQLAASRPVVLVRPDISAGDLAGIAAAAGVLTGTGGRTSHAAVVARQLGKVCLVGCADLRVDRATPVCTLGGQVLHEGDVITLDGGSGLIYAGGADVVVERPDDALAVVDSWRRQTSLPAGADR